MNDDILFGVVKIRNIERYVFGGRQGRGAFVSLCNCRDGHATPEEARNCVEVAGNLAEIFYKRESEKVARMPPAKFTPSY